MKNKIHLAHIIIRYIICRFLMILPISFFEGRRFVYKTRMLASNGTAWGKIAHRIYWNLTPNHHKSI